MLVAMKGLLLHALENGYAIPALNANNMEQVVAIFEAADKTGSPVIIQFSRGARKYARGNLLTFMLRGALEEWPHIPTAIHLDHGNEPATCFSAMQQGFSSVMMDGSLASDGKTPLSYGHNVAVTRQVVQVAHAFGITVEGELGCLGSLKTGTGEKEDGHGAEGALTRKQLLTDPDEAARFVAETGVDCLAVAIGTSHGAYKFSEPPTGDVLAIDRIEEIHAKLPNVPLVMHGSSSVPQELQDVINRNGGRLKQTWGVPIAEIQRAAKLGVAKVNVDTDNRLAMTGAIRQLFAQSPEKFDPRDYLKPALEAMRQVCIIRMEAFGSAGRIGQIKPLTLQEAAKLYAAA